MRQFFAAIVAAVVSACAGADAPKLEQIAGIGQPALSPQAVASGNKSTATGSADSPIKRLDAATSDPTAQSETIIGLKKETIVLYRDENGFEGERIVAGSFSLPAPARRAAGNPRRLEVLTAAGMRWVDRADVAVSPVTR